ncbi:WD40 repeat-like protein [Thozetella sp. PMI_491]|nr:WD40 repeat-like protein [Thozetella sp. PMI_491]
MAQSQTRRSKHTSSRRPTLPIGCISDGRIKSRRHGSKITRTQREGSLRQFDRFIPSKTPGSAGIVDQFRSSKSSHELTDMERLLRDERATPDPFFYDSQRTVPMSSDFRVLSLSEASAIRAGRASDQKRGTRELPHAPFKVLDAPNLRDDFYCSILAYSPTCRTLAVGLGNLLYSWSESKGTEELLVGDEQGSVFYYVIEWPNRWEVDRNQWQGQLALVARISINTQQICGLAWSPKGDMFACGGNDNICCLFETKKILGSTSRGTGNDQVVSGSYEVDNNDDGEADPASEGDTEYEEFFTHTDDVRTFYRGAQKHRWVHGAAVKAIAFCPWQDGLVATGGGSNDKCIHFWHTTTGTALASISVSAQVTSLIWSTSSREIAATFGYAQPKHPVRIAVFSWPECQQVAAIPWSGEHRALYAISYPASLGSLDGREGDDADTTDGHVTSRGCSALDGCIIVASSDNSVKFHEVWSSQGKVAVGGRGMLGGSSILESMEGIGDAGGIIR